MGGQSYGVMRSGKLGCRVQTEFKIAEVRQRDGLMHRFK